MVRIINKKSGFTIAEALISMLILSVFIGLSMKIFTKKHTKPVYNASHGTYVCYRDADGNLHSKFGAQENSVSGDHCVFRPAKTATYYVLSAVGGGGGGNSTKGGSAGQFETMFLTNIADDLKIYPGAAGQPYYKGSDTVVKNNSDEVLLSVKGGLEGTDNPLIKKEYVRSCQVVPLAKILDDPTKKSKINNSQADDAKCDVGFSAFTAKLCPTESNIKDYNQKEQIHDFYYRYAQYAYNATNNNAWKQDTNNGVTYPALVSVDDDDDDGVWMYDNAACKSVYCAGKKYVFDSKGDKLYYYPSGKNGPSYLLSNSGDKDALNDCLTENLSYNSDILVINGTTDSYSVIRATDKFKYIIDLKYDLTKSNTTEDYIGSGFGEYLKNASLKDVTTQVLFMGDTDVSMGDGGAKNQPGMPGAVFIAW